MGLPKQLSVRTMRRLLNDIGFSFRKRKRNCALLERDDIIVWRRKYLRTIREMRKEKRSFTLAEVEALLDEAIALVTPENWARDCAHVVRLEEEAWEQDGAIESALDSIIITLGSDSSSCSDSSVSEFSGKKKL
ncbi:hypothetical protein MTO96_035039 [Rhipicephalus appendiculatus]